MAHAAQAAPALPHTVVDCMPNGTQVSPLQQPVGQEVASQMQLPVVLSHSWVMAHAPQVAAPEPHEVLVWDA
jgi:hypothetical protein